jgi:type IV pilus modification protein PilV
VSSKGMPPREVGGFTLIEVLVAMIILAVGLLGLQALAVTAVHGVGKGQQQSEYAVFASSLLEERIQAARDCLPASQDEGDAPRGHTYTVEVSDTPGRKDITVRISNATGTEFELTTSVFDGYCGDEEEDDVESA